MAEVKFTSGPWLVSAPSDSCDYEIYAPETNYVVAGEWGISEKHDAHLIAASPALYEALKRARNQLDEDCFTEESRESCLKFIYEVLALAEGKKE